MITELTFTILLVVSIGFSLYSWMATRAPNYSNVAAAFIAALIFFYLSAVNLSGGVGTGPFRDVGLGLLTTLFGVVMVVWTGGNVLEVFREEL